MRLKPELKNMKYTFILFLSLITFIGLFSLSKGSHSMQTSSTVQDKRPTENPYAILAGGCFWCIESEFRALDGVIFTESGYIGGETDNPTYRDITTGKSGHAEAIRVYYNPEKISYRGLLDFFFRKAHDPTQLNRQGIDVGTQYRSAVFYETEEQKKETQAAIDAAEADKVWKKKIVTTLEPATKFYRAEEYHQQYYEKYEDANGRPHIRVLFKKQNK